MLKFVLFVCFALINFDSHAAKIVFDPTNFGRNAITAAQTARQTVIQTNQLMTEVRQYQAMLVHLQKLPSQAISERVLGKLPTDVLDASKAAVDVYENYRQMSATMKGLHDAYQSISDTYDNATRVGLLSGQSLPDMLAAEVRMRAAGRRSATNYGEVFSNLAADVENYQRRSDGLAKRIPQNSGLMEGLGTLGAQNHIMIDQLSNLVETSNLQAKASAEERQVAKHKEEVDAKYRESWESSKDKARKEWGLK